MIVKVKDKEVELKFSFRAYMFFEDITGHSFAGATMSETVTFLYCIVLSSCSDYSIKFDDFLDTIDENPNIITEITDWLMTNDKMTTMLLPEKSKKNLVSKKK